MLIVVQLFTGLIVDLIVVFKVDEFIILSPNILAVRSLSFAGSAVKAGTLMGDNEKPPLIGGGLSPLCLQEKRGM